MNKEEAKLNAYTLRKYSITWAERMRIFNNQKGCCAICGKHENMFKRRLAIEHDHSDGRIRGLACYFCNCKVIGKASFKHAAPLVKYLLNAYPEIRKDIKEFFKGLK